jgi:acyl-CoA thioesterase-1
MTKTAARWNVEGRRTIIPKLGGFLLVLAAACGGQAPPEPRAEAPASQAPASQAPDRPLVVFLGTSLTAGLGLDPAQAYPALIQAKLASAGLEYHVVNAGVSGETSAGALRRVDWLLKQPIAVLVVETGANDGLRGQDPEFTRKNIQAIFDRARRQSPPPRLVLLGMETVTNYGEEYTSRFRAIYPELARANDAALVPFLLEGVAGNPDLNQADGIHPTAEGQQKMAATVWEVLEPFLLGPSAATAGS